MTLPRQPMDVRQGWYRLSRYLWRDVSRGYPENFTRRRNGDDPPDVNYHIEQPEIWEPVL